MKLENIGSKIIGIGEVTVLPGETKEVPKAYETSPILEVYRRCGTARIIGNPSVVHRNAQSDAEERAASKEKATSKEKVVSKEKATSKEKAAAKKKTEDEKAEDEKKVTDEALRQARLAMLDGISEDGLIKLADDLGISFADCKDSADMLCKVEEALKN